MIRAVLLRILAAVPLLVVTSLLTFLVGKASKGDPVKNSLSGTLSPEQVSQIRHAYGLDLPLWRQYVKWVGDLFAHDGGTSIVQSDGVFHLLWPAFVNTLILAAAAVVLSLVLGVLIGTVAALNHRRIVDRALMGFVQIGSNLSVYWFGLVLIWVFAIRWQILPPGGKTDAGTSSGAGDLVRHLVLPGFSAAIISMLIIARFTRAGVIDSLNSDYARTYRSQGLSRWQVVRRHVARNVAPVIVSTTGLEIGALLSGVVFVEAVFSWPGLGTALVQAIGGHDYPLVQGGVLLVTVTFIVVNLLTDIAQDLLNPRLRAA